MTPSPRFASQAKRYDLMIWPPHCLIGTPGQAVVPDLMDAINELGGLTRNGAPSISSRRAVEHLDTEHYSAVRAEVPDPNDPTTQLNTDVHPQPSRTSRPVTIWAGEAASHCVANTMRDTFTNFGRGRDQEDGPAHRRDQRPSRAATSHVRRLHRGVHRQGDADRDSRPTS
jgi:nicotinamidase-related amidase